jgi:hypothetical protein
MSTRRLQIPEHSFISASLKSWAAKNITHIKECKSNENPDISPTIRVEHMKVCRQPPICGTESAKLTGTCGVWISQISSHQTYERSEIIGTGCTRRWIQENEFRGCTVYLFVSDRLNIIINVKSRLSEKKQTLRQKTFNQISVGGNPIHPFPPSEITERL